jgi:hypothetical protein
MPSTTPSTADPARGTRGPRPVDVIDRLHADLAALRAAVDALLADIDGLRRDREARQPRDDADAALRQLLPHATRGLPFTASQLLAHGRVDRALGAALGATTIATVDELGAWLRDHAGCRDGVTIARLRRRRWHAYTSRT